MEEMAEPRKTALAAARMFLLIVILESVLWKTIEKVIVPAKVAETRSAPARLSYRSISWAVDLGMASGTFLVTSPYTVPTMVPLMVLAVAVTASVIDPLKVQLTSVWGGLDVLAAV